MAVPFYISCAEPAAPLFRLADGRFQLTKEGPVAPFMYGPGYFLLENQLADFLRNLDIEGVTFEPSVIWHRRLDRQYSDHTELAVERYFVADQINELDLNGLRFYTMDDRYLFASPELKKILADSPFEYLEFSVGLSSFAAHRE